MKLDKDYLLFDLDGTLVDSEEGITNGALYALERFGLPRESRQQLRKFIGPPLRDSFVEFYGFDGATADRATAVYREYYASRGLYECTVYDGVPEVLDKLRRAGKRLFLATSKLEVYAHKILRHFGLWDYFEFAGGSDTKIRTSKSKVLEYVIAEGGIADLSRAVMIGDRWYDVEGAAVKGIDAVGVLYGFGTEAELLGAGASAIAATPRNLLDILLK